MLRASWDRAFQFCATAAGAPEARRRGGWDSEVHFQNPKAQTWHSLRGACWAHLLTNSKSRGVNPFLRPGKFDVKAICFDVGVSCGEAAQVLG